MLLKHHVSSVLRLNAHQDTPQSCSLIRAQQIAVLEEPERLACSLWQLFRAPRQVFEWLVEYMEGSREVSALDKKARDGNMAPVSSCVRLNMGLLFKVFRMKGCPFQVIPQPCWQVLGLPCPGFYRFTLCLQCFR